MGDVDEKEQEEEQQQEDEKEDAEEEDEDEDGLFPVRRATLRPATKPTSCSRRALLLRSRSAVGGRSRGRSSRP